MNTLKNICYILCSFLLISCTDDITLNLETAPPRLVIDASIDWIKNTSGNEQKIKLTTTTGYYNDTFPTVSGAKIVVVNSSNRNFYFLENKNTGEYFCTDFIPEIGETYTLTISLNGQIYTATETLIAVPSINDYIEQNDDGGIKKDEMEIIYSYQDDGLGDNYYLSSVKNPHVAYPEYLIFNNENTKGNIVSMYYYNEDLKLGDILELKLYGISKNYYEYFFKLLEVSGESMGIFSTTPSSIRGNIINETNFKNYAYGYFRLSEVDRKYYKIK